MRLIPRADRPRRVLPARSAPVVPGRPPSWQRRWLRHRRWVAACLAGVAVWGLASTLRPRAPATARVVTATHDLVPGSTLTDVDLALAARPADSLAVDTATDVDAIVGRLVAGPVHAGEAVRERDVVGATLLDAVGTGLVATSVRLSDEASLVGVRRGDVVDVVAARTADGAAGAAVVVAGGVHVLTLAAPPGGGGGGLLGSSPTGPTVPVLVVATTPAQALDIASAAVGSRLSVTLRVG